ncbi:MAG: two-component sensor histidine kinase [Acaryochloridaceae cyanobacterium SU_2_1]|nr:two-component sensor histidine kinase [Acaryochloridaceae cyanobacterium SU_2_1]NJM95156.1 two-component sensor histidine kinase [Acaryochloridaceae cyanobacterium CSU_5_19]
MVLAIVLNRFRNPVFQRLRLRLLLSYLIVMAAILAFFGAQVYLFVTRRLYDQVDSELQTLAQSATLSLSEIKKDGKKYLDRVDEVPWRDIFNRDRNSLEWFSADGELLARKGVITLHLPPRLKEQDILIKGQTAYQIRAFTISVHSDSDNDGKSLQGPFLEGYIRASQSVDSIQEAQDRLLWGLSIGGVMALGLVGIGGLWLTERSLQPIEESFLRLKQFTADASHELRTPLTVIRTSVDVMMNHPERIHPKDARKIDAISGATAQMNRLVEDLLFLARTDRAVPTARREWTRVALDEVLKDLLDFMEPAAQAKDIELIAQGLLPMSLVGDAMQLARLFANLLRNALQHTPAGGTVVLAVSRQNQVTVISIEDTGVGISREQIPFIFNRFYRADESRSRRQGGVGLGLAIAQSIAYLHKGKITIKSQLGVGSCFRVHLPTVQMGTVAKPLRIKSSPDQVSV